MGRVSFPEHFNHFSMFWRRRGTDDGAGGNSPYHLVPSPAFPHLPLPGTGNTTPQWPHVLFTSVPALHIASAVRAEPSCGASLWKSPFGVVILIKCTSGVDF